MNFLFLFLLCAHPLPAQQLSLDSCLTLALQNNVRVQNAVLELEAAKEVKKQAFTKYFPNVSVMGGGFAALNPLVEYAIRDIDNSAIRDLLHTLYAEYGATLGMPNTLSLFKQGLVAGATAFQPVFMGGQIVNGNRLAKLGIDAAECQNDLARQEVLLATEESYWLVVSLEQKQKTVAQVQVLLDTLYKDVSAARAAGLVTQNDVLKVALKQNEMGSMQLKLANGLKLAKLALCQSVGVTCGADLQLTDTLSDGINPNPLFVAPEHCVENRMEAKLLRLNVEAEALKRKMEIGKSLPQITVGGSYSYSNLFERNSLNGMLFFTARVPLTAWWESGHKIKQQKLKERVAENNRIDLTEKLLLQTRQAWYELEECYRQIDLSSRIVSDARENLSVATLNYRAGLVPLSDLLEAQSIYQQTLDRQCDNRIAYRVKLTRYKQMSGK